MDLSFSELFNSDIEAIRQITEALPAGVYITDTKGQLLYFNPAALEKSGRQLELGSRRWFTDWDLYYADGSSMPHEKAPMALALEEERPVTGIDMLVVRQDGKKIDCIAHSTPMYNDGDELIGCITLLTVPAGKDDESVPVLQGDLEDTGEEDPSEDDPAKRDFEGGDTGRKEKAEEDSAGNALITRGSASAEEKLSAMIERRHAERILRKNEEKYRTLVENFPNGAVGLFDEELRYTAIGGELFDQLGVKPEERIGSKITEIYPQELMDEIEPHFWAALQGETNSFEGELYGRRMLAYTLPITDEEGEVFAGMLVVQDITQRWQAQQDLRKSEEKYRTLFSSMNEGFCILKVVFDNGGEPVDFQFLEVNSAFNKQTGLDQAEGKKASQLFEEVEQDWVTRFGRVAMTGDPAHFEIYSTELERWIRASVFRMGDPEDHKVAVLFNDVTERKENEINNARLSAIINGSDDAIISLDLDGEITSWNHSAEQIFGYSADEAIGRSVTMLMPEDRVEKEKEILRQVRQGEDVNHYETIRLRKDGSRVNISLNISQIKNASGEIVGLSKIARDVTERIQAQKEREDFLREVETERQRLAEIFKRAPSFMCIVRGPNHVFERANDLYYQLTGNRELIGKPVREAVTEAAEQGFIDLLDQVYETGEAYTATNQRIMLQRGDDQEPEERFLDFVYQPLQNPRGEITGIFVQGVDLTERRKAQEKLQKMNEELEERVDKRTASLMSYQEQLRSLSSQLSRAEEQERYRLATELHDNLGQMLAVNKMKIELLQKDPLPGKMQKEVEEIKEGVEDALIYTRDLMSDLKPPPSLDKEDVTATIEWVANKMKKHNLQVTVEDDGKQKRTGEDIRTTLLQSVRETLFNVVKHAGVNRAKIHLSRIDSNIQIIVEDEGKGFDPESRTSTSTEKGGFGLFNISERMDLLGGSMNIDSAPGEGTKVTLIAPAKKVTQAEQRKIQGRKEETSQTTKRKEIIKVMLVDDHQMIREGLRKVVNEEEDLQVIAEASDGVEALENVKEATPHVVVMDVNMPHMNGIDATQKIKERFPEIHVIGLSLHDHEEVTESMRSAGATAYITKNEAFETLVATIRSEVT